jgi:ribosomal protein L44E
MAEHYTRSTETVFEFCPTCMRVTEHHVSDARLGRCKEHGAGSDVWTPEALAIEERTRAASYRKLRMKLLKTENSNVG